MLWKKESQNPDALYVDLLMPEEQNLKLLHDSLLATDNQQHPKKSDVIALQKRNDGNEKFRARKWLDAIELYGDSLRFAQPDSEHISLAFANRAACFMSLKLYENCLKDIELAKGAGYPEHLMPKLERRNENCLKKMQEDPQSERELSIKQSNDEFPCLANVAEVRKGENGEYSVVAKTDVDVGEMIVVEDAFQKNILANFGSMCNLCLKEYGVLVPCRNCTNVMFCPDCQQDSLHDYECGVNFCGEGQLNKYIINSVRLFLQIFKAFPNIDDLMAFVEQCRENPLEWPSSLKNERSKYQLFFNNTSKIPESIDADLRMSIYLLYKSLLDIPHIKNTFQSIKHRRFLVHLIYHMTVARNYGISSVYMNLAMVRYFKNSCNPNVIRCIRDGKSIYFLTKPVKQGEQFHVSYNRFDRFDSIQERQKGLLMFGFEKCECRRCNGEVASPAQCQQINNDPICEKIIRNFALLRVNVKSGNPSMLMDDCTTFLRKYGRFDWCEEVMKITDIFERLYDIRLTEDFDHPLAHARLIKFLDQYRPE